jgi:outer membrane protein assembly factor BamB
LTKMKSETIANVVTLILMFAMVISLVAIPSAKAQDLIMNVTGPVLIHSEVDIDLNGPSIFIENVTLWVKYPGRADFTYIGGYPTTDSGDLDVYDFDFNETGDFELKWALPPDFTVESAAVTVECITKDMLPPRATFAFIGAMPNPVGVGQEVLLHVGITHQLASAVYGWEGLTITVERPDGHTETLGPFRTDATGGTGTIYVPNMAGNYTLQTHFPEQLNPAFTGRLGIPEGTKMLASDSDKLTLVVQEEPIAYYPGNALPTEYWTRPIDAQLREWNVVGGNWLATPDNMFAAGNEYAPDTVHILWTTLLTSGGTVGGALDNAEGLTDHSYEMGDAYEGKWGRNNALILGGRVYYEKYAQSDPYKETVCVDLHTGETLWSRTLLNNLRLSRGQLMYWDTYDYHGVYDYLWASGDSETRDLLGLDRSAGSIWCAFDPFTGDYVATLTNMPSGTFTYGPKGEMLIYSFDYNNGYMTLWNSSNIPDIYSSREYASMGWGQWKLMGRIIDATGPVSITLGGQPYVAPTTPLGLNGYQWNKTMPTELPGSVSEVRYGDRAVGQDITLDSVTTWGFSLKPGQEGQLLFKKTWTAPSEWETGGVSVSATARSLVEGDMVSVLWVKETRMLYGFSLETGDFLWASAEPEDYLNIYGKDTKIAYGKVFSTGVSGIVYCYDAQTGELLWKYYASDPYTEILWANQWWMAIQFIADGKLYLGHEEHSPIDPRPRGAPYICLNATTGEEIFRSEGLFRQNHWGGSSILGDSIIATMDSYDQRVYGIGKGPSATTVSAPDDTQPLGIPVLVKGTVTDVSPGTEEYALTARFPNGVPAVSDANMSDWMLYVYKQFERPASVMGVEVIVSVVDPNNNVYEVGRTTSDSSGAYGLAFDPEVPGKYTIIASFDGSGAYYGSFAETFINVEEAPAGTPEPTPTSVSAADLYLVPGIVGIIVAIIVVGAILMLMLRKR